MALNFSYDSNLLASPKKSLYGPIGPIIDGYLSKKYGCLDNSSSICSFNKALEDNLYGESVNAILGESDEPTAVIVDDILDRLPRDPFGMNMMKSTFPGISNWIKDFDWHFPSEYNLFGVDETNKIFDYELFRSLYWGQNGAGSHLPRNNNKGNEMCVSDEVFDVFQISDGLFDSDLELDGKVEIVLPTSHGDNWVMGCKTNELKNLTKFDYDGEATSLHDDMPFVLDYLNLEAEVMQQHVNCWKKQAMLKHTVVYGSLLHYRECPF